MAEHTTIVERSDSGTTRGIMLGIFVALAVAVAAFFVFGGPGRFIGPAAPNQTNINVPAPNAPAQQVPAGPQINLPPKIDVNLNQQPPPAPAAAPPAAQAPAEASGPGGAVR
jgi:flagellar basal body-associated protein FliL